MKIRNLICSRPGGTRCGVGHLRIGRCRGLVLSAGAGAPEAAKEAAKLSRTAALRLALVLQKASIRGGEGSDV